MTNDEVLKAVVEAALSAVEQARLVQLNQIADIRPLTSAESQEFGLLLERYDHAVLGRAHALALIAMSSNEIAAPSAGSTHAVE